jgi:hypothetical protein
MCNEYVGYNIVAILKQLMAFNFCIFFCILLCFILLVDISSLIKEVSGKCTSVIGCTLCINRASLYSGNSCVGHFSEAPNSTGGQIKSSLKLVLHSSSMKTRFPVEFQIMSNIMRHVDPLLGNDREIRDHTSAVAK